MTRKGSGTQPKLSLFVLCFDPLQVLCVWWQERGLAPGEPCVLLDSVDHIGDAPIIHPEGRSHLACPSHLGRTLP